MREIKMAFRWSIVTAGLIALFWTIWYLVNGEVPIVTSIKMTGSWTLVLPFGISRWWYVLIGPIWSVAFVFLLTSKRVKEDNDLVPGLIFGLGFGLTSGITSGLGYGLVPGLIFGLVAWLGFGLGYGRIPGLIFGLVYGLTFVLASGMGYGLVPGLIFGLVAGLTMLLSNRQLWGKVWNWLMVK